MFNYYYRQRVKKKKTKQKQPAEWKNSDIWKQRDVSCDWPDQDPKSVLHGRFQNLPKQKSNVVRVFISSTFTGMMIVFSSLML